MTSKKGPKSRPSKGSVPKKARSRSSDAAKGKVKAKSKPKPKPKPKPRDKNPRSGPRVTTPNRNTKQPFTLWRVLQFFAPVGIGIFIGLSLTGYFLWTRALSDVDTFLARPPSPQPAVLLSAPMRFVVGERVEVDALRGDLLAGGYTQVDTVTEHNQFSVSSGQFNIKTGPYWMPSGQQPSRTDQISIRNGTIVSTSNENVVLRPTVLARFGALEKKRTPVLLSRIPSHLPNAVLGMEDHRFHEHGGIDPIGIARALVHNLTRSGSRHGGSTITQQLAKNLFLSQERTLQRKIREVFFASALESRLTKNEILELYLSEVYLGQVTGVPLYGVEAAARAFFGISASQLSLPQSATLAAIISSPNGYSPIRHPEIAIQRRNVVLDKLQHLGQLTEQSAATAKATPLQLISGWRGRAARAPWAVDAVVEQVEDALGPDVVRRSGVRVHTTIQPHLQRIAQKAVYRGVKKVEATRESAKGAEAALVAMRADNGDIVALVGGHSYFESSFNRATHAKRQAGSIIKPFIVLSALNRDPTLHPASLIKDEAMERTLGGKTWRPENSDRQFLGQVTIRTAIERSRNIPSIHLSERVGLTNLQADLTRFGFQKSTKLPSVALGAFETNPLEATAAYTVFVNHGVRKSPRLIEAVIQGEKTTLWTNPRNESRVASAQSAALTHSILEGVIRSGTAQSAANLGIRSESAGKTGTTDQFRDAWFTGYTPTYVAGVWVGKDKGRGLQLSGAKAALPIWSDFMVGAAGQRGRFAESENANHLTLCADSHELATAQCPEIYDELFWNTQTSPSECSAHGKERWSFGNLFRGMFSKNPPKDDATSN